LANKLSGLLISESPVRLQAIQRSELHYLQIV
jgi:hypothetical protein